jgi:hypothetical protein
VEHDVRGCGSPVVVGVGGVAAAVVNDVGVRRGDDDGVGRRDFHLVRVGVLVLSGVGMGVRVVVVLVLLLLFLLLVLLHGGWRRVRFSFAKRRSLLSEQRRQAGQRERARFVRQAG